MQVEERGFLHFNTTVLKDIKNLKNFYLFKSNKNKDLFYKDTHSDNFLIKTNRPK